MVRKRQWPFVTIFEESVSVKIYSLCCTVVYNVWTLIQYNVPLHRLIFSLLRLQCKLLGALVAVTGKLIMNPTSKLSLSSWTCTCPACLHISYNYISYAYTCMYIISIQPDLENQDTIRISCWSLLHMFHWINISSQNCTCVCTYVTM